MIVNDRQWSSMIVMLMIVNLIASMGQNRLTVSMMSRRCESFKAKRQNSYHAHDNHFSDLSIGDCPGTSWSNETRRRPIRKCSTPLYAVETYVVNNNYKLRSKQKKGGGIWKQRKFVRNQERRRVVSSNTKLWKTEAGRPFFLSQESKRSGRSLTFNPLCCHCHCHCYQIQISAKSSLENRLSFSSMWSWNITWKSVLPE